MKVLVSVLPPADSLAVSRLNAEDYAIDLEAFLDKAILAENEELISSVQDLKNRFQNRLQIFIDLWSRHPKVRIPASGCDLTIKSPSDIKSCVKEPAFHVASERRNPQGLFREMRSDFYARVFEPFVSNSKLIEIIDPYILGNLANPKSGIRWFLDQKISKLGINLVLITVLPRRERVEGEIDYLHRLDRLEDVAVKYLKTLINQSSSGIRLIILPESSAMSFDSNSSKTELQGATDNFSASDKHDRFIRYNFARGKIGVGLTKGCEYFANERLLSAWRVTPYSAADFASAVKIWGQHDPSLIKEISLGTEFTYSLPW
jgi:hypothetical protein